MHPHWTVSFREEVVVSAEDDRDIVLQCEFTRLVVRQVPSALLEAFKNVAHGGMRLTELTNQTLASNVPNSYARLIHYLQDFARHGLLVVSTEVEGQPIATLDPVAYHFRWPRAPHKGGKFVLSRFAFIHRRDDEFVLESPLAAARIILHDSRAAEVVFALNQPTSTVEITRRCPDLVPEEIAGLVSLLHGAEMLTWVDTETSAVDDPAAEGEERKQASNRSGNSRESGDIDLRSLEPPELQTWEFHDLLFHSRSRMGRHDGPVGAIFPFVGQLDAPPAVNPIRIEDADTIELPIPDQASVCQHDVPLVEAVERRRSIREYGDAPLTLSQLSEFLYRTMRVREQYEFDMDTPHGPVTMDFASRPYPSGGGLYELEVYPVIQRCDGLDAGLYYYDGVGHRLARRSEFTSDVDLLVSDGGISAAIDADSVQVLLVISARFARMAWKYRSMAYAAILKHVGVVYQTMYLTATAMGLAPCAVGAGNSDLFTKIVGGNYYEETSVGEFLLGSRGESR